MADKRADKRVEKEQVVAALPAWAQCVEEAWEVVPLLCARLEARETWEEAAAVLEVCSRQGNAKEMFLRLAEMFDGLKKRPLEAQMRVFCKFITRIDTKHLSKFILDYSNAVIAAAAAIFRQSDAHYDELYTVITEFAEKRAAELNTLSENNEEEKNARRDILHSFITRVFKFLFRKKSSYWSIRYYTLVNPYKMKFRKINDNNDCFNNMVYSLKNIALNTSFDFEMLWKLGTFKDSIKNDSLKFSSSNTSISLYGSIFLLGAYVFENPSLLDNTISKFLNHMEMVILFLKHKSVTLSLIDVNLFLGLYILNKLYDISVIDKEYFLEYIEVLSLISSSSRDSSLRFLSYVLMYSSLMRHSENTTITYIENILNTSPLENLKTLVISILKDEIQRHWDDSSSLFISSIYNSLLKKIFHPNPPDIFNSIDIFLRNFDFIMQALNLYIFLLKKPGEDKIGIKSNTCISEIKKYWINPLMNFTLFCIDQLTQTKLSNYLEEKMVNKEILNKLFLLKHTLEMAQ
ncbi:hypothetical protein PORY_001779 [Pneumocystis oryctolagi]|uniref:Uncharacterized protein n=1 Tax=Pneumocystis oryctolagi TaxID=42067 RepID=A0ACB7CAH0_9ASCO|nr:hypothetical protein PORY_001779 [Pneumocystis oryctolagi]